MVIGVGRIATAKTHTHSSKEGVCEFWTNPKVKGARVCVAIHTRGAWNSRRSRSTTASRYLTRGQPPDGGGWWPISVLQLRRLNAVSARSDSSVKRRNP